MSRNQLAAEFCASGDFLQEILLRAPDHPGRDKRLARPANFKLIGRRLKVSKEDGAISSRPLVLPRILGIQFSEFH